MSENTNRETFHQMGSFLSDFVQQATGRKAVSETDGDWVTVGQNKRWLVNVYTGDVIQFEATEQNPLTIIAPMAPVQDLNGYDYPWQAGGGKNLLNDAVVERGYYAQDKTYTSGTSYISYTQSLPAGSYTFSTDLETCEILRYFIGDVGTEVGAVEQSVQFTLENAAEFKISMRKNDSSDISSITPHSMIEIGSTVTSYSPYSNICPITGWTGVTISQSSDNPETTVDPETTETEITFPDPPETVYSGSLKINQDGTGLLVVDRVCKTFDGTGGEDWRINTGNVAQNRMSTLLSDTGAEQQTNVISNYLKAPSSFTSSPEKWQFNINENKYVLIGVPKSIESVDDWKAYLSDNNLQICYYLAEPEEYELTEEEVGQILPLLGENFIWSDTGAITVLYHYKGDVP